MGFTLNSMTMLALTLSVGIVIDDAIVVLENIYRFIEEKHEDQFQAAVDATKEIGLAVLATTLSLVAIFVPVGFMGGIVGRFMKSFGLTMAFAIMVSLLVSFTLTPMLSARWLKVKPHGDGRSTRRRTRGSSTPSTCSTRGMLEWSMAHRGDRRGGRGAGAALERAAVHRSRTRTSCRRTISRSSRSTCARRKARASKRPRCITNRVATAVRAARARSRLHARHHRRRSGARRATSATIYVRLKPIEARARDQFAVMDVSPQGDPAAARARTCGRRCSRWPTIGGGGAQNADVQFLINGPDLKKLDAISQQLVDAREDACPASSTSTRR